MKGRMVKSFKEQLEEGMRADNLDFKKFIKTLNLGDPDEINIDYDLPKEDNKKKDK